MQIPFAHSERSSVGIEWETPSWNAITSGGWSDRWDMSVGSMTVMFVFV